MLSKVAFKVLNSPFKTFTPKKLSKSTLNFELVSLCNIDILWRKIDSHTGNKKNDLADKLAKEGINK